jgi:hypothetical protein
MAATSVAHQARSEQTAMVMMAAFDISGGLPDGDGLQRLHHALSGPEGRNPRA